jgi:DNA polymerase-3 subunit delta
MARRTSKAAAGLTVPQLTRALERAVDPVYLVVGAEAFLRHRAIEAIVTTVVGDGDRALAIERLDGATTPLAAILDAARSLPLFLAAAGRPLRVVHVSRFDPGTAEDAELLGAYLDDPVEETCLVLEAASLDARRAASKLLDARATRVSCAPPERESDVRRWIMGAAGERGLAIEPAAVTYLLEMVGLDLERLSQELDKASLLAAGGRLDARHLESLLGRSREHSVFELTDALVDGRHDPALRVLNRLLDDGEEPVKILAMVSWVVRQLITAADLAARGCPERELLQQLGGRWNQRRLVLDRARRCDLDALEDLLVRCSRSDAAVKMQRGAGSRGTLEGLCRTICAA